MDMKKILQTFDGAATKPVQGTNDMKKFMSIVRENANPYTPVEENVITSFEEGSVGGDANAFLIAADTINDTVMAQVDKIKINADPQLLKNLMNKFNEFMSAYHAVGKEILQPDMFDELPGDATSTDNTDESVEEGWGSERQERELAAANKQRAAEYKEVIARHKDDPVFLDYLRMFLINNWGGFKAEKGAEEWIAQGKPLPDWFIKMKKENPESIATIFDRLGGGVSAESVGEGLTFKDYFNLQEAKQGLL